jgi:hypothetical protein
MRACDERAATERRPAGDDDTAIEVQLRHTAKEEQQRHTAKEERQRRELDRSRPARKRAQERQELASEDEQLPQLPLLQRGGGGESGYYGRLAEAAVRQVLRRDVLRLLADEALDLLLVTLAGITSGGYICVRMLLPLYMCPHAAAAIYVSACCLSR